MIITLPTIEAPESQASQLCTLPASAACLIIPRESLFLRLQHAAPPATETGRPLGRDGRRRCAATKGETIARQPRQLRLSLRALFLSNS